MTTGRRGGKWDGADLEDSVGVCPALGFDIGVDACIQRSGEYAEDLNSLKCIGPGCPNYENPKPKRKPAERIEPKLPAPPPGLLPQDVHARCIERGCQNGVSEHGRRCHSHAAAQRAKVYKTGKITGSPETLKKAALRLAEGFTLLAEALE